MMFDRIDPALLVTSQCRYGDMTYLSNDRYIGSALARYGEYSESEVALWREMLDPRAIVADVGSNLGAHTVALASLVPQGMVYAFEPLWFMHALTLGNVARNGYSNVRTYHAAAGATPGTLTIPAIDYTRQGAEANYGGMNMEGHAKGNPVPVLRLDDICPMLHMIKADVEGMEKQVLEGAQRIITQHRPVLYLENNPGPQQQDLITYVHSIGYDAWWHHAPHYNPNNYRQAPPEDDQITKIVSFNMICLPSHPENLNAMGCDPIPRVTG